MSAANKRPREADGLTDGKAASHTPGPSLLSSLVSAHALPLPAIGSKPLVIQYDGHHCLMWDSGDCLRLRALGRVCASPIGLCAWKVATRGKAAAVPVVLNDEELWVCQRAGWPLEIVDIRSRVRVSALSILEAAVAADPSGFICTRRLVFEDLWRRGYRCTNGLKFGCDYLSYTADASQVHAAFMVIIRRESGSASGADISPMDLVARSRVATTALKICVMAYGDPASACVRYAAFKRMGPGTAVFQSASAMLERPLVAVEGIPIPPAANDVPGAAHIDTAAREESGADGSALTFLTVAAAEAVLGAPLL